MPCFKQAFISAFNVNNGQFVSEPYKALDKYRYPYEKRFEHPDFISHNAILSDAYAFFSFEEGTLAVLPNEGIIFVSKGGDIMPVGRDVYDLTRLCKKNKIPGLGPKESVEHCLSTIRKIMGIDNCAPPTEAELNAIMSDYPGWKPICP